MTDYLLEYLIDYLPEEVISEIIRPYTYNYLPIKIQNNIITYKPKIESYFTMVRPYSYHNAPATGINVYSFSLYPHNFQPSGHINLMRMSTASLV